MIKLKYYKFILCKSPICHVIDLAEKIIANGKFWQLRRACSFSQNVIKFMDQYNAAKPLEVPHFFSQMLFYSPSFNPNYTVGLIDGERTWNHWLGNQDPNLETLSLRFSLDMKREAPLREFEYMRGPETVRFIRVMRNDPRWEFYQKGEQQPFEMGKSYEKVKGKKVQDYFTFEDLLRFATNWGCPFGDDNFWNSDGKLYSFGELPGDDNIANWKVYPHG